MRVKAMRIAAIALAVILSVSVVIPTHASSKKTVYVLTKMVYSYPDDEDSGSIRVNYSYNSNGMLKGATLKSWDYYDDDDYYNDYKNTYTYTYRNGKIVKQRWQQKARYSGDWFYTFTKTFPGQNAYYSYKRGYVTKMKAYTSGGKLRYTVKIDRNSKTHKWTRYRYINNKGKVTTKYTYRYKNGKLYRTNIFKKGKYNGHIEWKWPNKRYRVGYEYSKNGYLRQVTRSKYNSAGKIVSYAEYEDSYDYDDEDFDDEDFDDEDFDKADYFTDKIYAEKYYYKKIRTSSPGKVKRQQEYIKCYVFD